MKNNKINLYFLSIFIWHIFLFPFQIIGASVMDQGSITMIKGQELCLTVIPNGMNGSFTVISGDSSVVSFYNGKIKAEKVGSAVIEVSITEGTGEDQVVVEQLHYNIDVFDVRFITLPSYGYLYPDRAAVRLKFVVDSSSLTKTLSGSTLSIGLDLSEIDINLSSIEPIEELVFIEGSTEVSSTTYDKDEASILIHLGSLLEGTYEIMTTVKLEPEASLTIGTYKNEYVGKKMIPIKSVFKVTGHSILFGTNIKDAASIPIENSPSIR